MTRRQRDLIRLARAHGWRLERTRGGYWRLRHPAKGHAVIAAFTPSSGDLRILAAEMRRAERQANA